MAPIDLQAAKQQMLRRQLGRRGIHDPRVLAAMAKLPREQFIRPSFATRHMPMRAWESIAGRRSANPTSSP